MAWSIRSIDEASAAIRGAFRRRLPGTDTALKNNFVTIVAKVLAGMSHEFELRMAYLAKQLFARTAALPFLVLHGADVKIFRKQPSAASGTITGEGEANRIYPAGIRFVSGNNTYLSTAPAQASPFGAVTFLVTAQNKGVATNRDSGGSLALADPALQPTLGSDFVVGADGLGGGADIEDVEDFRARVLFRKANPPGAGKLTDYEQAALDVSGVLKAWAFRDSLTPSFIAVYFLFKGRPNLIPTEGDVLTVQAAIEAKRMIRVNDSVAVAPEPVSLNPIISNLVNDSVEVRELIDAALTKVLFDKGRPGLPGSVFVLSRSWISEAISSVAGEDSHVLTWPAADLPFTNGQYPVLGSVSYA